MKHRRTKLSLGIKIASILSCVAILSAGFAAWWIVKTPTATETGGSFEVYEVLQKEISVTNVTLSSANIVFGVPASTSNPEKWLLKKDTMSADQLNATLDFNIGINSKVQEGTSTNTTADATTTLSTLIDQLTITMEPSKADDDAFATKFNTAVTNGSIVVKITGTYKVGNDYTGNVNWTYSANDNVCEIDTTGIPAGTVTFDLSIDFAWGPTANTNHTNPYDYYNTKDYSDGLATEAFTLLNDVYALNGGTYKITIGSVINAD